MYRRYSILLLILAQAIGYHAQTTAAVPATSPRLANLAPAAESSTSYVSGHETITALNDDIDPANSNDKRHGAYGNWPQSGTQWVEYVWPQAVTTQAIDVYWFDDARGVRLPTAAQLQYWDGEQFVAVANAMSLGLKKDQFNRLTFEAVKTTRLRLQMESNGKFSTGILEWRVYDTGASPNFAPRVDAGVDRTVVIPAVTYLRGAVRDDGKRQAGCAITWSCKSDPGVVAFADAHALTTTARFARPGKYAVELTATDGEKRASDAISVTVLPAPTVKPLGRVTTQTYHLTSSFWRPRMKNVVVNWIPHCYQTISDPDLKQGGIDNFVQAGKKLAGLPHGKHRGAVFANGWVYNTLESMCLAQLVAPDGDEQIALAQRAMRATIEDWIPKILSAQEPDGYLQTFYTLTGQPRWSNPSNHEAYVAGYFIEAGLAHFAVTDHQDRRLYDAAKKLADCWCDNIGPAPNRAWYGGHEEMEQALVRLATVVNRTEGGDRGGKYLKLALFLLNNRRDGHEYDQTHVPVVQQYEAVGHAVRAVYLYSGIADVARETGDPSYMSAACSLWDNIVNKKYYITGGVGSGETAEGFGKNYSLPNHAYCESCANCGMLFFQHKMNRLFGDARFADVWEETLYNGILGSIDLDARQFTYTNPLDASGGRYPWHGCPCCVGNIPRTLLRLPTWTYSLGAKRLYVNLFVGGRVTLPDVAGGPLTIEQTTDYPWKGHVAIAVQLAAPRRFTLCVRLPNRSVSALYANKPTVGVPTDFRVNDQHAQVTVQSGYAMIDREWAPNDTLEFTLPLIPQTVRAVDQISADRGRVALRYGPLVYNIESVDQDVEKALPASPRLTTKWRSDMLGGIMTIQSTFTDGSPMLAIPNFARLNRGGRSIVWIRQSDDARR